MRCVQRVCSRRSLSVPDHARSHSVASGREAAAQCAAADLRAWRTMSKCGSRAKSRSTPRCSSARARCVSLSSTAAFGSCLRCDSRVYHAQLILTDAPRLIVLSAWSGKLKKEIFLTPDTKVNAIGQHTFDLISVRLRAVACCCYYCLVQH